MDRLELLSPVDGRYGRHTESLANIFSEKGLIRHRVLVEGEYLLALSGHPEIGTREFSNGEKNLVRGLCEISTEDAQNIKTIETKGYGNIKATNHDVKAVEYYIKDKLSGTSLEDSLEWIHFGLTSEDVNNLAYGMMLSDGIRHIIEPSLIELQGDLGYLAKKYRNVPILARTHGQPATPSTFGKEFNVFASRLERQLNQLIDHNFSVKLNGASGNYNAQYTAYPKVDWREFTVDFVNTLNIDKNGGNRRLFPNFVTTQIEPHDTYAELFDNLRRINTILIDFNQDMWRYISDDWIIQKPIEGEIGSSAMPHKINPIDFENSEGNLGIANALFGYFSSKLPISRLQRDLSDSTVERNFGVALGHSLIGYKSTLKGLGKIMINENKVIEELRDHPEIISEAIQTILRREGVEMPYEKLKAMTRGRKVTMNDFELFIDCLDISEEVRRELKTITPENYVGLAGVLSES